LHGGEGVATGTLRDIERNPNSETARCLKTPVRHPIRGSRRALRNVENWIKVRGARANNLKNVDVRFPVGRLSVITGISGSGKSTLMHDVILPTVRAGLGTARVSRAGERGPRSRTPSTKDSELYFRGRWSTRDTGTNTATDCTP